MSARAQTLADEATASIALECTHCGVSLSERAKDVEQSPVSEPASSRSAGLRSHLRRLFDRPSAAESPIRYFCCPRCGRWQSTLYAREVIRSHAGARPSRRAPARSAQFEEVKSRMDAWMARLDREDPHAVLGVSPRATPEQVRERYRELALAHHPDRGGHGPEMQRINQAYERIRARRG